ncbi:hypothetical protein PENSPDRAFT_671203 [Peniophora sp. CONT]|nr:hypothetical protein PENSPDRAFT_671203 [Peniophora sp. CONT]
MAITGCGNLLDRLSNLNPISDYDNAVYLVFEIQNELQVDLRVLIKLLQRDKCSYLALQTIRRLTVCGNRSHWPLSRQAPEREVGSMSGESMQVYLGGLCRPASRNYLAFVYLSTQYAAALTDEISPHQVLDWAERITEPFAGVAEQGDFLCTLFPTKEFDIVKYHRLPTLSRHSLRSPYQVWASLQGCCLWCQAKDARFSCSFCGRIKYCGVHCQKR